MKKVTPVYNAHGRRKATPRTQSLTATHGKKVPAYRGLYSWRRKTYLFKSSGTMEGGTLHPQQANRAPYLRADKNKNEQRYNQPSPVSFTLRKLILMPTIWVQTLLYNTLEMAGCG